MENKRPRYGAVMYSLDSSNIIHPTNGITHPGLFDKEISKTSGSFPEQFPKKGVTWPGALRTKHTTSIPKSVSIFAIRNGSGYAARNNGSLTTADLGRAPDIQDSDSGKKKEDEIKLVWEANNMNQTDPTPNLLNLSRA